MDAHFVSSSGFSRSMQQRFDGKVVLPLRIVIITDFLGVFYFYLER